jgi:Ser/Thr protein kinase RdoA (MazF antagonist)
MSGAPIDLRDARFRRDVERLHRLGPRPLAEMLAELAARRLLRTEIDALVARYARLDGAALDAAGGRGWPR